jgi:hypothetical protein
LVASLANVGTQRGGSKFEIKFRFVANHGIRF